MLSNQDWPIDDLYKVSLDNFILSLSNGVITDCFDFILDSFTDNHGNN